MDIKQTSNHLQRLGQPFDVIITKDGVERVLYTNLEPTDVEGLLNEVLETHNPDTLVIQERKRNGSTNLKQNKFNVSLGGIETPATPTTMPNQPVNTFPSDFKDYLISDLKEKKNKLEKKLEGLEAENEKLKKENFELEKENKYKDKEFELDKKATEFEKSNGLAGIMETVSTNPALATIMATAVGRLMGIDVPQVGALEGGEAPQAQPEGAGNSTQEKVAGFIRNWLLNQDEKVVTQFFELTNLLAQDISLLDEVLDMVKMEGNEETA
jgi:hypothetical protein